MTAHPLPSNAVRHGELIQLGPQILVLLTFPAQRHGLDQELRVRMEYHGLSGRENLERFDGGHHFHAIVGGVRTVARALSSLLALLHDNVGPPSWTRVPEAATVRIDLNTR